MGSGVVVIGAHNDIALYRELMRRGVSEYLVPPLQTLQLIRAITTLYADPSQPFVGRQIAFAHLARHGFAEPIDNDDLLGRGRALQQLG